MGSVIIPKLIVAPESPVTIDEAKAHLRIYGGDSPDFEDATIQIYIDAAVSAIDGPEGILRRSVLLTTWEIALDEFPESEIRLPCGPLQSVTSVKYTDGNGDEQTVDANNYVADNYSGEGWIVPVEGYSWPVTMDTINAVRARWVAGLDTCPPEVKAAVLLMIGHLYGHRGDTGDDVPPAVERLLRIRKRIVIA